MWGALIVFIALIVLFCAFGTMLMCGNGAFLIAGYNTASSQEKAKYDEKALCRAVGTMMFTLAGCFLVSCAGLIFDLYWLVWAGQVALLLVIIAGVIYLNTTKRIKRK